MPWPHTGAVNPGWYSDPFSAQGLRWWDGTQWTSHTAPSAAPAWAPAVVMDPHADLAAEESAGRRAQIGLVVAAATTIAAYFFYAVVAHRLFHDVIHQVQVAADNPDATPPPLHLGGVLAMDGLSVLQFGVQVLLMIWLYRAATFARRSWLPARRDPVWAWVGFLVPIVNLWFPYQVAVDSLPPGHPAGPIALRWWLSYLGQSLVLIAILILAYFSISAALVGACAAAILPILTALYGRGLINAVLDAHRGLAESRGRG